MRSAIRLVLLYSLFAGVWIVLSDRALEAITSDTRELTALQTYKGWAFVVSSALLIFVVANRDSRRQKRARERMQAMDQQLRSQLERSRSLHQSALMFSKFLDFRELAEEVVQRCVQSFGASTAWICERKDDRVRFVMGWPEPLKFQEAICHARESEGDFAEELWRVFSGEPVYIIDNLRAWDATPPWKEEALKEGVQSLAFLSLASHENLIGVLCIGAKEPGYFTSDLLDLFQAYAHQAAIALESARLFTDRTMRLERLRALRTIDLAVSSNVDLTANIQVVLEQVTRQLGVDAADIMLLDREKQMLTYGGRHGFDTRVTEPLSIELDDDPAGAVIREGIVVCKSLQGLDGSTNFGRMVEEEGFVTYIGVPLVAKNRPQGVLEIYHRAPFHPEPDWMDFLYTLAGQAAITIENGLLLYDLEKSNAELMRAYDMTLEGWAIALELRDVETYSHTRRVTDRTVQLARAMGVKEADLVHVRRGALLHDIGKLAVPDHVLLKPGPLTDGEWEIMCRHPEFAFEFLSRIPFLKPALDIPYCHHERWDGRGYPRGLRGHEIPLAARVFSVIDVTDALNSSRRYSKPWPKDKIREYLVTQSSLHFDPQVVETFLGMEDGQFFESMLLDDLRRAKEAYSPPHFPARST